MTTPMTKTIVELDLKDYSDLARILQENLSVEIVALLNEQIQGFVDAGLKAVKIPRRRAVLGTAGDNAFVVFDRAEQAHRFARAVHEAARAHNTSKTVPSARRWFRIGAATGEICFHKKRGKRTVAGITIANAVRLEARPAGRIPRGRGRASDVAACVAAQVRPGRTVKGNMRTSSSRRGVA